MFLKKVLVIICVFIVSDSFVFSMYQAPTSTLTQPAMEAIRKTSGYGQSNSQQLPQAPFAKLNPQVLKTITNELIESQPIWSYEPIPFEPIWNQASEDAQFQSFSGNVATPSPQPNQMRRFWNSAQGAQRSTPLVTQAKRQYGQENVSFANKKKKLSTGQKFILKKYNARPNEALREYLQQKYNIKFVPQIYQSSTFDNAANINSFFPTSDPVVIYSTNFEEEFEFLLLHEIGHSQHKYMNMLKHWILLGLKPSIILGVFLNIISIKYGIIGAILAPKLLSICYSRYFEEPHADDFAVRHGSKDRTVLKNGLNIFKQLHNQQSSASIGQKIRHFDYDHPSTRSRIRKIQNALDGNPNYFRLTRFFVLLWVIKEVVEFAYAYSSDATTIQEGLEKIKDIENNFETYCDKFEIPTEGRPMYKYALENVKQYFKTKLATLKAEKEIILDEETIIEQAIKDE